MEYNQKAEAMGARMQAVVCDKTVTAEAASDFSLPDYRPEIKRLLRVTATVFPADQYLGAGSAELSGTVEYHILYAGNDGALYSANQTGEYRFSCPIEPGAEIDLAEGLLCDAETISESSSGRVTAPRRVSLKCRLRSRVRIYGTRRIEAVVKGGDGAALERLSKSAECARVFVGHSEETVLEDEILCDASVKDLRVISAESCVALHEAEAGSGCVHCRGEVMLKLLTASDSADERPAVQLRKIPFSVSVPVDGAEVNCSCIAMGSCRVSNVTVDEGRILCEVAMRLKAYAQRNEEIEYVCDLYSTNAKSECRYETVCVPRAVLCNNGNFSVNAVLSLEEAGLRREQSIVDIHLMPCGAQVTQENGKYTVVGRCRALAVLYNGEEYGAQEFEVPFRYEVSGATGEMTDCFLSLTPIGCRARMDGERISLDAELMVGIATRSAVSRTMLAEAVMGEAIKACGACYTVAYPSHEDTLWSVAKRYRRSVGEIARMNPLSGSPAADAADSLNGISYLLV